ncbi:MAG: glutathione S-transferase family protein [Myxococcota bacterium]|jgi:glutathione S-transferase|nr:glutathione S-transferase [Deltaproteobacteria bacterium]MCP4243554.1 glutathione S-transferase family protein [bacterium]MDP6073495.1 glutathione S-transferase family protein [Myxococcota bacterium]MDP6244667.1 glutathione S-transferase family protein [Myxococcota bacterium]MDP7076128.1 glutathione S-transferase family protein [Myxococcota bacterium]
MSPRPLKILGAPGSPYSRKLRSVLRYRRIPHLWIQRNSRDDCDTPEVPVSLLPVLVFPGEDGAPDTAAIDSTPLIRRLESDYPGRSVIPTDPVMAFIDALLEDYADEWLTKAMFHYRWAFGADVAKAASVLPFWTRWDVPDQRIAPLAKQFSERQIARLWVVGSNETTGPVIEASYRRYLTLLDAHLTRQPFLMGTRPASSDFGAFGQLTQLGLFDPTPAAVTLETAPRVISWVEVVEDLSGTEPDEAGWTPRDAVRDTLRALLGEVGRVYAPFLLANAAALDAGAERVECEIDGEPWVQKPFPYQGKCLASLRAQHAALSGADRDAADGILAGTGCEALFRA